AGSEREARRPGGQHKPQLRSSGWCAFGLDRAAVRVDDALSDVEPEAGPAATAVTPELGEDTSESLRRYPVAFVGDDDLGTVSGRGGRRADGDGDGAGAVTDAVLEEVADDLGELVRVDPH